MAEIPVSAAPGLNVEVCAAVVCLPTVAVTWLSPATQLVSVACATPFAFVGAVGVVNVALPLVSANVTEISGTTFPCPSFTTTLNVLLSVPLASAPLATVKSASAIVAVLLSAIKTGFK
nr:hypothetical protein [Symbiopectobacterium purcellii]